MLYSFKSCPDCGGPVVVDQDKAAATLQQIEEVRKAGLCGPEMTSIIGFLTGACHTLFAMIRKYDRDVYQLRFSRGRLV